ncbi:MAG: hypothetical protein COV66_11905, partial [Nitrospinae bacterium CG11_big_fil_rev_8_21_14_0_20_45_15]
MHLDEPVNNSSGFLNGFYATYMNKINSKSPSFFSRLTIAFMIYLIGGFPTLLFALPQGGQVAEGVGVINQPSSSALVVNQSTNSMVTNWQSFSIGTGESVQFVQPGADSIALNRVLGGDPSVILGSLTANGQVFISNGSGILFGKDANVNVGGLLATTLNITDQDFMAGNYRFTQDPAKAGGFILNQGTISATQYVGLLAAGVENAGSIIANLGSVSLASGESATLDFIGDGLINFAITEAVKDNVLNADGDSAGALVANSGNIQANGGRVVLSAQDAGSVIRDVVNNTGVIEAHSVTEKNGEIFLLGGDQGIVNVSGILDASGKHEGESGGTVQVLGEKVGLFDSAKVDVSGESGGGTALIGGDVQGGGSVSTSEFTFVDSGVEINANATGKGDGGKVVVWAQDTTRVLGDVSAKGGELSGKGGFVETSGKKFLEVLSAPDVTAKNGDGGQWLIDPNNLEIVAGSGSVNTNVTSPFLSSGDSSQLGVDLITSALTGGASVTITTGTGGGNSQDGDITLSTALDFNGTGSNTLTLSAHNDIIINNVISDAVAGGDTLNLFLIADNDLSGLGNLVIGASGSVNTGNGLIDITAHDIDIQGFLNSGTATTTIASSHPTSIFNRIGIGSTSSNCGSGGCTMVLDGTELQNITASQLVVNNTGNGIYVDNVTAVNSAGIGSATFNSDRLVQIEGGAVTFHAMTANAKDRVDVRTALTTTVGDLVL